MNAAEHIQKADRNKKFAQECLANYADTYPDWVSTVAFYSALHFVEAFLATHGLHYRHHSERNTQVSLLLREIENEYLDLYDFARNSRYGKIGDMPSEDEARNAVNIDLAVVEEFVKSRLPPGSF